MLDIHQALPHRAPFLFIDAIVSVGADRVEATRVVRADEPHFAGHYPGAPVMPGVLLCEAVLQAGCFLMASRAHAAGAAAEGGVPVVARISEARFTKMVRPGDTLDISASYERSVLGAHFLKGEVRVGNAVAASLSFTVMMAPAMPA